MYISFRIGEVFAPSDPIARFVTGVCLIANDLTTLVEQIRNESSRCPKERSGVSLHLLYTLAARYREAAKFVQKGLEDTAVRRFVGQLSSEASENLSKIEASFTPWKGSFVEDKLKPLRDSVFHYPKWDEAELEQWLDDAAEIQSGIEIGRGRYRDIRFDYADEVASRPALRIWGATHAELGEVMQRLAQLTVAITYFASAAASSHVRASPRHAWNLKNSSRSITLLRDLQNRAACLGRRAAALFG
jgi:hypothetical protein